jgi:hypothetical protein
MGSQGNLDGLVTSAGDLKEDLVLPLEVDLPIIQLPGGDHGSVQPEKVFRAKAFR